MENQPLPPSRARTFLAILILGLCGLAPAEATTYVMMPDEALVDSSPLIVEARVISVSGAPAATPSTDYRVEILRLLKGNDLGDNPGNKPGAEIVVRRPGGINADGRAMKIWGLTRLGIGDRALLFLVPRQDGTYGVNQLILGAFREIEVSGERVAVRDLDTATELRADASGKLANAPGRDRPRDAEGFARWIVQRVEKRFRPADYFRDGLLLPKYNLLADDDSCGDGRPIRWFTFDSGGSVSFTASSAGQPGLADGGFPEIQTALAAWTNDPGSPINYLYGGTTASTDLTNNILFEDPTGLISGSYSCGSGGIVAVGGPSYPCALQTFKGETFHPASGASVITQDGIGCIFAGDSGVTLAQELFAHELGHTLGLDHSNLPGALMNPVLHAAQPLGAALSPDEMTAVGFLYGSLPRPPAAPANLLAAAVSSSQINLAWTDSSTNEDSFRIEMNSGFGFNEILSTFPNVTQATVGGLAASTSYAFRIRARNTGGDSAYPNPAAATTLANAPTVPTCSDPNALCLAANRFSVTATFDTTGGLHGTGQPVRLTADTGYFWFFAATNVEVVIKVLDACGFTARPAFWVFAGGLTDVHMAITVTDLVSGQSHVYVNPIRTPFQPIQDTETFQTCGAH